MQKRIAGVLRQLWYRQEGMQTLEWLLLIGLIGTVLLGLMAWFSNNQSTVGTAIWNLIQSWLNKMKP
jgi:fructose-specific phosphotransferase system IIC component